MRRFLVSVARPALHSRPALSSTSSLRPFATSTGSGSKSNPPSQKDGDASRRTGDYGPADGDKKPLEQEGQGGRGGVTGGDVGQRSTGTGSGSGSGKQASTQQPKRSFATAARDNKNAATQSSSDPSSAAQSGPAGKQASQADAANKSKAGKDPTHHSPTPTPEEAQQRKASGKSAVAGSTATEVHRKQEEYTAHRDLATGAEMNVAADRAAHDPLPDKLKHSTKVHKQ